MPIEITVPRLGWSMDEGSFVQWLKADGEFVNAGDLLFTLESDKATQEIESIDSGVLRVVAGGPRPGETVIVGQLLGYLLADGETLGEPIMVAAANARAEEPRASAPTAELRPSLVAPLHAPVTPRARRAASRLGVDLATLNGSGRGGRIRERDVLAAVSAKDLTQPIPPLRRRIADRMMRSRQNTAPVTLTTRVDATKMAAFRQAAKATNAAPSYTDILVKLTAEALIEHPALASRWEEDRIVPAKAIHVGVAVDTERGLLVPVLRDVPSLTLTELSRRSRELIEAARSGNILAEDMQGGVFTVTNLGAFGIDAFTPIIHYPQCAVLGVGEIQPELVVAGDGEFAVRQRMTLSLTFDHCVLDGAPAARFLQTLRRLIEACRIDQA